MNQPKKERFKTSVGRNFSAGARILKKFAIFSKSRLTSITFPRIIAHVERLTLRNAIEYWGFA